MTAQASSHSMSLSEQISKSNMCHILTSPIAITEPLLDSAIPVLSLDCQNNPAGVPAQRNDKNYMTSDQSQVEWMDDASRVEKLFRVIRRGSQEAVLEAVLDVVRHQPQPPWHQNLRNGSSALHLAAAHGHASVANTLLMLGHPVNAKNARTGYTAIDIAAFLGDTSMVQLLCLFKADVERSIPISIRQGNKELAEYLLAYDATRVAASSHTSRKRTADLSIEELSGSRKEHRDERGAAGQGQGEGEGEGNGEGDGDGP